MQLTGIHHVTAITANASANHDFYTNALGMRLVKKTVNQDDVSAYHLFYADGQATPGTDLTFFDWPVTPERRGTHAIVRTGLRVSGESSLRWWSQRLSHRGLAVDLAQRDNRLALDFEDFEGQRLSLIDDGGLGPAYPWAGSPVPPEHQIRGLGPVILSVPELKPTDLILTRVLAMQRLRAYQWNTEQGPSVHVYQMARDGLAGELHVMVEPEAPPAVSGAGSVHHAAFRTPDTEQYHGWIERLNHFRIPSSGPVDRYYFRSLYFREPNGILLEIATDGPGFTADEPLDRLGQRLALPPFLEGRRSSIEAGLKPLVQGNFDRTSRQRDTA